MKIGFFTSIEGWGGSETYLLAMMKGVRASGHVPILFGVEGTRLWSETAAAGIERLAWKMAAGGGLNAKSGEPSEKSRKSGMKPRLLGSMPAGLKLLFGNIAEIRRLQLLFQANRVDVMHVSLNGYEVAGVACRLIGVPSVGWHCIMPCKDTDLVRRWLNKWTCHSYTLMGGMSQACVEAWRQWSGYPRNRCRMVWNGIDLTRFSATKASGRMRGEPFIILAVGRLHPMKGFDVLIRAVGLLSDPDIRLVLAGEGPMEAELKALATVQPLPSCYEFMGHSETMESLYQRAHCLVLPSVSHESFGFVLAEAMACGLPLVTSDFGPLPEINVDGATGLVVARGDVSALARALAALREDPLLCRRMGALGMQRARQCFDERKMVGDMLAIYESLALQRVEPVRNDVTR